MCGIAGLIGNNSQLNIEDAAARMAGALIHRGPDGQAYYADQNALLVHTRLSIVDLGGGTQPIRNADGSTWVSFNGEIFNYQTLRSELEAKGIHFYTQTDTEVIVHLYDLYGLSFVEKLNGQFAICLWDRPRSRAILIRDRVGICPLYYCLSERGLAFGSEAKAILALGLDSPSLNPSGLDQLFTFWTCVGDNTLFSGIQSVLPGEMLCYDLKKNSLKKHIYWDYPYEPTECLISDPEQACEELVELLGDAVKLRMIADVEVGAYLSGGLDSSVIAYLARQQNPDLRTFSLSFAEKDLDESVYQREMCTFLGTKHSQVNCSDEDITTHFLDTIYHTESAIVRSAPVPMSVLSRFARSSHCKVVLTGEGADEVFGGYDLFKEAKIRHFWSREPHSKYRPLLIQKLYPYMDFTRTQGQQFIQNYFAIGLDEPEQALFSHLPRMANTAHTKRFYSDTFSENLSRSAKEDLESTLPRTFGQFSSLNKALYLESKTLMPGYLLSAQGDRMLMKHSIEGRFPFLDHRLIEFAARLKSNLKIRGLNEKYILKSAFKDNLPKRIVGRYKQPYRAPNIPAFLGKNPPEFVSELLGEKALEDAGVFSPKKVNMLLNKIKRGRIASYKDNAAFVSILSYQAWHDLFLKQASQTQVTKPTIKRIEAKLQ